MLQLFMWISGLGYVTFILQDSINTDEREKGGIFQ